MQPWQLRPARDFGLPLSQAVRSLQRESGLGPYLLRRVWWWVVRLYLRVFHRLSMEGTNHLPHAGPFILAANHASHLDALVLAAALPARQRTMTYPVAAGDTSFTSSVAAAVAAGLFNALPLWRRKAVRHALADLRQRIGEDQCIFIVFPEGTRTRTGTMQPFKSGLGMLVAGTSVPVIPCHLSGTFAAFPPDAKIPRPRRITLRLGAALRFESTPNDREGWTTVARELEAAVRELESPSSEPIPPPR